MKMVIAIVICSLSAVLLFGQEAEAGLNLELDGFAEQEHVCFFRELDNTELGTVLDETKLGLRGVFRMGDDWRLESSLRGLLNIQTRARRRLFLNELFLRWTPGNWSFLAGKQIIDRGELTGYSAADWQNRMSYFDFLDLEEEDLGVWALRTRWTSGRSSLSLTLFPAFQPARFFVGESRWLPLPATAAIPGNPAQPAPASYEVSTGNIAGSPFQFMVGWDWIAGNVDWKFKFYHGLNAVPHSTIRTLGLTPGEGLNLGVDLEHERLDQASAAFSSFLGAYNIWGELTGARTRRLNLAGEWTDAPYFQLVLGADRLWIFPDKPESSLLVLLQYSNLFNFSGNQYSNLDLDLIFQNALLNKTEYQLSYRWKISLTSAWEIKHRGFYTRPAIAYSPFPNLECELGSDLLFGPDDSFFGDQADNKRLLLRAKYLFSLVES